ncbi:MAG: hypothetical protein ACI3YM_05815, partial [Prevotella sp.]
LVLLLLCLCKSFKELLSRLLAVVVLAAKASAKVRLFSELPNFFRRNFQKTAIFSCFLTKIGVISRK